MLAGVVTGFKQGALYTAFGLLTGVGLAGGYALLGATWLTIKSEGELQKKSLKWGRAAVLLTAAGVAAISLATPFANSGIMEKWFSWPRFLLLSPLPILSAAAFVGILVSIARLEHGSSNREWLPFVLSVWVFVFAFGGLAYSLYPYLVVDRMTIWQAAAAPASLKFVFVGACIVLPMIVAYTVFSYRVFWGKARNLTYGA
jgi:cytochrome d ubiquinol oxidase subunit II